MQGTVKTNEDKSDCVTGKSVCVCECVCVCVSVWVCVGKETEHDNIKGIFPHWCLSQCCM